MTATEQRTAEREVAPAAPKEPPWWRGLPLVLVAAAVLIAYPYIFLSSFAINVGIAALTFGIAATGWNLLGGFTGQVSFGHAVFWAAGMYTTAVLVREGWSPWLTMIPAVAIGGLLAVLIGLPCFRLRGHYFSIATIAVGEIVLAVVNEETWLNGPFGLRFSPDRENSWANLQFSLREKEPYYYAALILFGLVTLAAYLFVRGKAGRYVRAIRDDDRAASAAGIPVRRYKLVAAAMSGGITAIAGSFQMAHIAFVDPPSAIALTLSIQIALIAVLGGVGSLWGPLVGAWSLIFIQHYTNANLATNDRPTDLLIYGAIIVAIVVAEPSGMVGLIRRGYTWVRRRLLPERLRASTTEVRA